MLYLAGSISRRNYLGPITYFQVNVVNRSEYPAGFDFINNHPYIASVQYFGNPGTVMRLPQHHLTGEIFILGLRPIRDLTSALYFD